MDSTLSKMMGNFEILAKALYGTADFRLVISHLLKEQFTQVRSQGVGCDAPPQISQEVHFLPQGGPINGSFCWRVKGEEVKKNPYFWGLKGPLFGGPTPP